MEEPAAQFPPNHLLATSGTTSLPQGLGKRFNFRYEVGSIPLLKRIPQIIPLAILFMGFLYGLVPLFEILFGKKIEQPNSGYREQDRSRDDSLFGELLLSILKTYYVDAANIHYASLLVQTLMNLNQSGAYGFSVRETGNSLMIEWGERALAMPKPSDDDDLEFTQQIVKLIEFLESEKEAEGKSGSNVMFDVFSALTDSFDPHTKLMSKEEYRELKEGTEGSFGGLGILVGIRDKMLTVMESLPQSPAERAGIREHDRILSIDGMPTFGLGLRDLIKVIRGDPGSEMALLLLRDNSLAPQRVFVKRELVEMDPVSSLSLESPEKQNVIMMKIESFSAKTYLEFLNELNLAMMKTEEVDGLIIDLRSNPGGLLDQAVRIADLFISKGTIVMTEGQTVESEVATKDVVPLSVPIVLLVDENTASASEILAGALQDHGKALVIGQPSFGKGTVQTVFELPNDLALKLTVARYFTPKARKIQDVGIVPDIWLQPVRKNSVNLNLFGDLRYRREKFLSHLRYKSGANPSDFDQGDATETPSIAKSYYLDDGESPQTREHEVELALHVIDSLNTRAPSSPRRSLLSGIRKVLSKWNTEADSFLKEHFAIHWLKEPRSPSIKLRIANLSLDRASVFPGEDVQLYYEVVNEGSRDAEQTSLFVRSFDEDTVEVLLGTIRKGETNRGVVKVSIPSTWEKPLVDYETGLAVGAAYLQGSLRPIQVGVKHKDPAILLAQSQLIEEKGGSLSGVLEVAEAAKLLITVSNSSGFPVEIEAVDLVNLSGRQIIVGAIDQLRLGRIPPHSNKLVTVEIAASAQLESDELNLGLSIESRDLKVPFFRTFDIKAVPGRKR
ncbi:MAG: PDZ domain-containing protein [Deltaproteobacteria bacterium]|nr:PDZ domain-containing protein [Deltaproteobacteria bacterium]